MPKNVLPRAMVWGGVADDPVYVDAANPVPVGGAAIDGLDTNLDAVNTKLQTISDTLAQPANEIPHAAGPRERYAGRDRQLQFDIGSICHCRDCRAVDPCASRPISGYRARSICSSMTGQRQQSAA
jgi:hypothetical protein